MAVISLMAPPTASAPLPRPKLREGVTTFLPTTWTESPEALVAMAQSAAAYRENQDFARTPFLHVEGPYLNPDQAGAQNPSLMRSPDIAEMDALHEVCPLGLISVAPELDGALPFIEAMTQRGITTSAAHSNATYEEFLAAKKVGLSHLTHFCNQMSPLHHRAIGLVGSGFLDNEVRLELICDTVHLEEAMIATVFKHVPLARLMLITDSIAASHLGDGEYTLSEGTVITVKDGVARIPAGNLAGSTLLFNEGLRHVARITGRSNDELVRTTGANQADSLGLSDRGRLEPGKLADVTLLDEHYEVKAVFVGGRQLL